MVRAAPTMRTPSAARVRTVASPMPRLAPVTTAVLSVRLRCTALQFLNLKYKMWAVLTPGGASTAIRVRESRPSRRSPGQADQGFQQPAPGVAGPRPCSAAGSPRPQDHVLVRSL